ncbi:hypothetical protein, partial [Klebsiella quasipneumoniae]|uniref:hypothetical protein n=1 Tax=Klebsiella quasipneumoniae TaxID=1463165 RepID=UPI00344FAD6D
ESKNERGKKIKVLRNYGITAARNWFNAEKDTYMDIIQKAAKATHRGGVKFDEIAKEAKDPLTQKQCKVVQTLYNTERTKLGLATVLGGCLDFA